MSTPQPAPQITPIGGEIILAGYVFEVAGHATDRLGRPCEVPGKCLRRASKEEIAAQNKRSGQAAVVPNVLPTHAPATSAPPKPPAAQPRNARRHRSSRGSHYGRYKVKPPPIVIHEEPASASVWALRALVAALVAAAIWFWNQGNEAKKWQRIGGAANAVQRR